MIRYVLRRVFTSIPTLFTVTCVSFLFIHLTPGDPVVYMLGPEARHEDIARVRAALGLDKPLPTQFFRWIGQLGRLNLGESLYLREPVSRVIRDRFPPTVMLTVYSMVLSVCSGVTLGIVSATHRGTLTDRVVMSVATLGFSVPAFWLGVLLILAGAVMWGLLPSSGYGVPREDFGLHLRHLILPSVALAFAEMALVSRITRSSLLEVLGQDYIRTARAKGLQDRTVLLRHALRNALLPLITIVSLMVGDLLGGAVVIENVFNIPGMGRLVADSVLRRDYPMIQGIVLFVAVVYLAVNLIADLLYAYAIPRIRYT